MRRALTLVFPHQLFSRNPAVALGRDVRLVEDTLFFGDPHAAPGRFHRQKIVLHRASMRACASRLKKEGFAVSYHDYERAVTIDCLLERWHRESPLDSLHVVRPSDFLLEKRLRRFSERHGVSVNYYDSPMFLTPRDWAREHFDSRRRPFLAAFYEAQRKRMGLLLDAGGGPLGGRWSYDEENRKPMPKRGLETPRELGVPRRRETEEALRYVEERFSDYPGGIADFHYAVTAADAEAWLERFLEERFESFGPYEDALSERSRTLFHSVLTPALNIGLITPDRVVDQVLGFANERGIPLASLEGFVRQIVGWREFIHCLYERGGVEMRQGNFFGHDRPIPPGFWTAETGVSPVDLVIRRVLETGYAHHIERLMVLGNFMLLCQFDPRHVCDWFMELFIDAYDWVMVPNVYGMSQFADGGSFATKPYFSGSNYLRKMSDYEPGGWCEVWDGLFWNFIDRHFDFFRSQYRLGMMATTWHRMEPGKREAHLRHAARFLGSLDGGARP